MRPYGGEGGGYVGGDGGGYIGTGPEYFGDGDGF